MVIVEGAESYRTCGSCGSNEDVINITILRMVGRSRQGSQISLCESCAQCLRLSLNDRYKGYGVNAERREEND
jgi:hypothetical protein